MVVTTFMRPFLRALAVAFSLPVGILSGSAFIQDKFSPRIQTQEQLEQYVKRERRKIDPLNSCPIIAELIPESRGRSDKLDLGTYGVKIGGSYATEAIVRHELYHILGGHIDAANIDAAKYEVLPRLPAKALGFTKYLFWYEPKALIYQTTGLKL